MTGTRKCLICIIVTYVCLAFVFGGFQGAWLVFPTSREPVYAISGETIIVADISYPLDLTYYSIIECTMANDVPHTNELYTVPNNILKHHTRSVEFNFTELFNQIEPDCTSSILPNPLYILAGTSVEIEICITSDAEPTKHGILLIFDDNKAFKEFISNSNCEPTKASGSIQTYNLYLGSDGTFECTTVLNVAVTNGHLYAIPFIPGKAWYKYRYRYTLTEITLVTGGAPLVLMATIPIGVILHTPTYLVVYVEPVNEDNSQSTHLCLQNRWSDRMIVLVVLFFLIDVVYSTFLCYIMCHKCKCKATKKLKKLSTLKKIRTTSPTKLLQSSVW